MGVYVCVCLSLQQFVIYLFYEVIFFDVPQYFEVDFNFIKWEFMSVFV